MTRTERFAEACVEYFEAALKLRQFEERRRPGHTGICDCDEECRTRTSRLNALGFECKDAFARAAAVRSIERRSPRVAEERHPRAHDETWVAKFNEEAKR